MVKVKVVFWKITELASSVIVDSHVEKFLERKPERGQSPVLSGMMKYLWGSEFRHVLTLSIKNARAEAAGTSCNSQIY